MRSLAGSIWLTLWLALLWLVTNAAQVRSEPLRIGYIGCLTGTAAAYGQAALEGVQLALGELKDEGEEVKLFIEDDVSETQNAVSAYNKLVSLHKVQGLVTGTWWANALSPLSGRDNLPLLSSETVLDKDTVFNDTYFIMQGDLREWVLVYELLVEARKFKRGAVIRFTSGFADTIAETMREVFSKQGREFVADLLYGIA